MHINGQRLAPEIFIELISSKAWTLSANSSIYTATKQEESGRTLIWACLGEVYEHLEPYGPRKINTAQYHYLSSRKWKVQTDQTGSYMEIRRENQKAISLWTILDELPVWGKPKSTIGETFSLLTAIKNRELIQSYDEYNDF